MKKNNAILFLLVITLILTGCSATPEGAAKQWLDAMLNLDGNKILDLTCIAQRQNVQQQGLYNSTIALLPQMFGFNMTTKGDVTGLKFTQTSINADQTRAFIHVTGEVRVAVLAFAQAYNVDETWVVVKEDNTWRWCGAQ